MCQIVVLTSTKKLKNLKQANSVISNLFMKTQKDGYGYAVLGKSGVYGERSLESVFKSKIGSPNSGVPECIIQPTSNHFGTVSDPMGGAIFHGRTSTNFKGLLNCQPIVKDNWSLIHNGVVTNSGPKYDKITSNDSEDCLHYLSTTGVKGIEDNLSGYYAIGAIDPEGNLHVIKDRVANLYVALNHTLDCLVFATTDTLIKSISKGMHWKVGTIERVKDDIHLVFNPNGELVSNTGIKSLGFGYDESRYAEQSLGYKVSYTNDNETYYTGVDNQESNLRSDQSLIQYEAELECMDNSYKVYDMHDVELTISEFRLMTDRDKHACTVVRPDGTVVDPYDYYTEKLA
jgi:predicted glutamine amidotransferase